MKRYSPMVAIDVATEDEALTLFDRLTVAPRPILKIGMELYYHLGPAIVKAAQRRGFKVFLDLKLHDIPNTVKRAMYVLGQLGVDFTTIHAAMLTDELHPLITPDVIELMNTGHSSIRYYDLRYALGPDDCPFIPKGV